MKLVLGYSFLLLLGITGSQFFDFQSIRHWLTTLTMMCLGYIMVRVGLEFELDKNNLKSYGWDYIVAMTAAAFPWIFCSLYFIFLFQTSWQESILLGRFAAPTSAGVLFSMLTAAGYAKGWFFKKIRTLAIFDDLDTVLFMVPLQMLMVGFKLQLLLVLGIVSLLLYAAYRWLHKLKWPFNVYWCFGYGTLLALFTLGLEHFFHIRLEVLLPAFVMGCLIHHPEGEGENPKVKGHAAFDHTVKALFMFLVGASLPALETGNVSIGMVTLHVLALTILSNIGKSFPAFCYRGEASLRQRLALCVGLYPRGEVGAGVLIIALSYGIKGLSTTVAGLSLALNLLLTAVFILIVMWLLKGVQKSS